MINNKTVYSLLLGLFMSSVFASAQKNLVSAKSDAKSFDINWISNEKVFASCPKDREDKAITNIINNAFIISQFLNIHHNKCLKNLGLFLHLPKSIHN